MQNVFASDAASAFILAASSSCTGAVSGSTTSVTAFATGTNINSHTLAITTSSLAVGVYRLCVRWSTSQPYVDAGVAVTVGSCVIVFYRLCALSALAYILIRSNGHWCLTCGDFGHTRAACCYQRHWLRQFDW